MPLWGLERRGWRGGLKTEKFVNNNNSGSLTWHPISLKTISPFLLFFAFPLFPLLEERLKCSQPARPFLPLYPLQPFRLSESISLKFNNPKGFTFDFCEKACKSDLGRSFWNPLTPRSRWTGNSQWNATNCLELSELFRNSGEWQLPEFSPLTGPNNYSTKVSLGQIQSSSVSANASSIQSNNSTIQSVSSHPVSFHSNFSPCNLWSRFFGLLPSCTSQSAM